MPVRVRFQGQDLWFHTNERRVGGGLVLASRSDAEGNVLPEYEEEPDFAHVYSDKTIRRGFTILGKKEELEYVVTTETGGGESSPPQAGAGRTGSGTEAASAGGE